MPALKTIRIVIAETSPIILSGLVNVIKGIKDIQSNVVEVDSKKSLFDSISLNQKDILIVNPSFGGLLHPDEIRKISLNPDLKIFALEISKLAKATLDLYDNNIHVTDDLVEIKNKITQCHNPQIEETE